MATSWENVRREWFLGRSRTVRRRARGARSVRRLLFERFEPRQLLAADWQNPLFALDVDDDGHVVPLDALRVINDLNEIGPRVLAGPFDATNTNAAYLDTDGDLQTAPIDALLVINRINEPVAPLLVTLQLTNDSGVLSDDLVTNDDRLQGQVTLAGAALDVGRIRFNQGLVLDMTFDAQGRFAIDPRTVQAIEDGVVRATLFVKDADGAEGLKQLRFSQDTTAPTFIPPRLLAVDDTGRSSSDGVTSNDNPRFTVEAESGARLVVQLGVETLFDAPSPGTLQMPTGTLSDGDYVFTAVARDAAGNVSQTLAPVSITIDTVAPPPPTFDLSPTADTGTPNDQTTGAVRVTLLGQGEGDSFVTLMGPNQTARVAHDGTFRISGVVLATGDNPLTLQSSDLAGNTSSTERTFHRIVEAPGTDPVLRWNQAAMDSIRADATPPPQATRALAMTHLALLDVVNAVEEAPAIVVALPPTAGMSAIAAVAGAGFGVLKYLYPAQEVRLQATLDAALAEIPAGTAKTDGLAFGMLMADALIALRDNDGWDRFVDEVPGSEPGQWRETAPMFDTALLPQWGLVEPFAVKDVEALLPPGFPSLDSAAYASALDEVRLLGRATGSTRTAEQTQIARFWADGSGTYTPPGHWNQIAAQVAAEQGNSWGENARLLGLLNAALGDAAIVSWDAKYTYDLWRPVTAIQQADADGNAQTVADPDWSSFLITPPFPEYVSGHSTFSGAAETVLSAVLGDNLGFSTTSVGLPGVTRTFANFDAAATEAGRSRVYGGIHYEFSNQDGLDTGRAIGTEVLAKFAVTDDVLAPRITFRSPQLEVTTSSNPTVAGWVLDNLSGVASLEVQVDQANFEPVTPDALGRFSFQSALAIDGTADGRHVLHFRARDFAGLDSAVTDFPFTLDTQVPTVSLTSPVDGASIVMSEMLTGIASGTGSAITALSYRFDAGPSMPLSFDVTTGSFHEPLNLTALGAGAHTLTITARDAAGLSGSVVRSVQLDALVPLTITASTPLPGAIDVGTTFRPQVFFSRAVDPATLTNASFFVTDTSGEKLPAAIVPARDGTFAWLFLTNPMPSASLLTLHVDGALVQDAGDTPLDANGDGLSGGELVSTFTTVSLTPLEGTSLSGRVVDPGPDLKPMTFDDIRSGPDGILHTADDVLLNPLEHVKVFIVGLEAEAVFTDATGAFQFDVVPSGNVKLAVDGRTAVNVPAELFFPEMVMDLNLEAGRANTVMGTMGTREENDANLDRPEVYLPRLQASILQTASDSQPTIMTVDANSAPHLTPEQRSMLQLIVQPGTAVANDGSNIASPQVGISAVPPELVRDMLPPGLLQHTFDITIQAPGVSTFDTPLAATFPNVFDSPPGSKLNFLSFDHTTGRLVIEGTATVSADGKSVATDPGTGITHPGWHGMTPPGGDGCSGGKPPVPPVPVVGETVVEHPPVVLPMVFGETGTFSHAELNFEAPPAPPGSPAVPPAAPANPCAEPKRDPDVEKDKETLTVYIEVDGPLSTFMKKTGSLELVSQSFTLVAGSNEKRQLTGEALKYDKIFGANKFADLFRDTLYGSQIKVTKVRKAADGTTTRDVWRFELFRWIDVLDATNAKTKTGNTAVFPRTLADGVGGFERQKSIWLRLPASVETSFKGFPGLPFNYGPTVKGEGVALWKFDPDPADADADNNSVSNPVTDFLEIKGKVRVAGADVEFTLGNLFVSGQASRKNEASIDRPRYEAELKRVIKSLRKAYVPGVDLQPGDAGMDDDGDGTVDNTSEYGWAGSDDSVQLVYDVMNQPGTPVVIRRSSMLNVTLPGADGKPGVADVDDDGNLIKDDPSELGTAGSDDVAALGLNPAEAYFVSLVSGGLFVAADRFKQEFAAFLPGKVYTDAQLTTKVQQEGAALLAEVRKDFDAVKQGLDIVEDNAAANIDVKWRDSWSTKNVGGTLFYSVIYGGAGAFDYSNNLMRNVIGTPGRMDKFLGTTFTDEISIAAQQWALAEYLNANFTHDELNPGVGIVDFGVGINISWSNEKTSFAQFMANTVSHELAHTIGLNEGYANAVPAGAGPHGTAECQPDFNCKPYDIMQSGKNGDPDLSFGVATTQELKAGLGIQPNGEVPIPEALDHWRDNFNLRLDGSNPAVGPDKEVNGRRDIAEITTPTAEVVLSRGDQTYFGPPGDVDRVGEVAADGLGNQRLSVEYVVTNFGTAPLAITSVSLANGAAGFSLAGTSLAGQTLQPTESAALTLDFDPSVIGLRQDTLQIASNGSLAPSFRLDVTGVGFSAAPVARIEINNAANGATGAGSAGLAPVTNVLPSNNLGGVPVIGGSAELPQLATITNDGAAPLTVSAIRLAEGTGPFRLMGVPADLGPNPVALARGESFSFGIAFDPNRVGLERAIIEITTNDPALGVQRISAVGTGLANVVDSAWGRDYVAIETPDVPGDTVRRVRSDQNGNFEFFLPASQFYHIVIFDPETGLVSHGFGVTSSTGRSVDLTSTLAFAASQVPDLDFDGLPGDIEFAIGTSETRADTDGDGLTDFAEVQQGLDPLGGRALPVGIVASLALAGEARNVVLAGTPLNAQQQVAYVATGSHGLAIVDATQFMRPILVGQLDLPGDSVDVAVDPSLQVAAVIQNSTRVHLIDVADPARPVVIRSISGFARQVEVANGVAYVSMGSELRAYDLLSGTLLDSVTPAGGTTITGLAREGTQLFSMDTNWTLRAFDIGGSEIVLRDDLDLPHGGGQLFVGNGVAYVAVASTFFRGGFVTVDVSDPGDLMLLSDTDVTAGLLPSTAIVANGSGLGILVGRTNDGVSALDLMSVVDPTNTNAFITRIRLPVDPFNVTLGAGLAFVADGTAGLQIVNYRSFDNQGQPPTVSLSSPAFDVDAGAPGVQVFEGATIPIVVAVTDDVQVRNVELLVGGEVAANDVSFPFDFSTIAPNIVPGRTSVSLQVRATDTGGNVALSSVLNLELRDDETMPSVVGSTPRAGNLALDRPPLFVRFDEPLDKGRLNATGVTLTHLGLNGVVGGGDDTPVDVANLQTRNFDHTLAIYLAAPVPEGPYRLRLDPTIIADRAGNSLAQPFTLDFAMENNLASAPPRVTSTTPAPGERVVAATNRIVLDFDHGLDSTLPQLGDFTLIGDGPDNTFGTADDVSVATTAMVFEAGNRLRVDLATTLPLDRYRFRADDDRLRDAAQNRLDGELTGTLPSGNGVLGGDFIYEFSVVPPRVSAMTPAPNAPSITVNSLELGFDRPMDPVAPAPADFVLVAAGPDGLLGNGDDVAIVIAGSAWNGGHDRLTLSLDSFLATDKYRLTVPAGKLKDARGNGLDGEFAGTLPSGDGQVGGDFVADFTVIPPRVTSTLPAPNSRASDVDRVQLNFDRPLNAALALPEDFSLMRAGPDGSLHTGDDVSVPISSLDFSPSRQQLTLHVASALVVDDYELSSTSSALRDDSNTQLDGEFGGTFPTGNGTAGGNFVFAFEVVSANPLAAALEFANGGMRFLRQVVHPVSGLPFNEARLSELTAGAGFFAGNFFVPAQLGNWLVAANLSHAFRLRTTTAFPGGFTSDELISQMERTIMFVERILTIPDFAFVDPMTGGKAFYQVHDTQSGAPRFGQFERKVSLLDNVQLIAGLQVTERYLRSIEPDLPPDLASRAGLVAAHIVTALSQFNVRMWFDGNQLHLGDTDDPRAGAVLNRITSESRLAPVVGLARGELTPAEFSAIVDFMWSESTAGTTPGNVQVARIPFFGTGLESWAMTPYLTPELDSFYATDTLHPLADAWSETSLAAGLPAAGATGIATGLGGFETFGLSPAEETRGNIDTKVLVPPAAAMLAGALGTDAALENLADVISALKSAGQWDTTFGAPNYLDFGTGLVDASDPVFGTLELAQGVVGLLNQMLGGRAIELLLRPLPAWETALSSYAMALRMREAEFKPDGAGSASSRTNASGDLTWLLPGNGDEVRFDIVVPHDLISDFVLRYSNDDTGVGDTLTILVDGVSRGIIDAVDTNDWNAFELSPPLTFGLLTAGSHEITIRLDATDGFGIELDRFQLVMPAMPLRSAGIAQPNGSVAQPELSGIDVSNALAAAMALWSRAGADIGRLGDVQVRLADLPGDQLGLAAGDTIWLDRTTGWGWFVDATPWNHREFSATETLGQLCAVSGPASQRVDLLTVLAHELGHVLGLRHTHSDDSLLSERLSPGQRRLPWAQAVDELFDDGAAMWDWSR